MRVVMADDHARMRGHIREALEQSGCTVVGEAADADEAIALTIEHRPDVALLDVHMPGSGIRAAHTITTRVPDVAVVMLTHSAAEDDLFDALRAGAAGYLLKDSDPAKLGDALHAVLAGDGALSPGLLARILDEFRAPSRRRLGRRSREADRLSAREWEVMQLLGEGLSTEEVASRLYLSQATVRVHVSRVLRKLRVENRENAFRILRGKE